MTDSRLHPAPRSAALGACVGIGTGAGLAQLLLRADAWSWPDGLALALHAAFGFGVIGAVVGLLLHRVPERLHLLVYALLVGGVVVVGMSSGGPSGGAAPPPAAVEGVVREPGPRVLLVGIDGADWSILQPLIDAGRTPNLAALQAGGVSGPLRSLERTASPIVWSTIATGRAPEDHGIRDFLSPTLRLESPLRPRPVNQPTVALRPLLRFIPGLRIEDLPVTSLQRRTTALWDHAGAAGAAVLTVGWWATWPARPIRGVQVSDHVAYQRLNSRSSAREVAHGQVAPAELLEAVRGRVLQPRDVDMTELVGSPPEGREPARGDSPAAFVEHDPEAELRVALAGMDTFERLAIDGLTPDGPLALAGRPDLAMVYFQAVDIASHYFWSFARGPGPGHAAPTPTQRARYGGTLAAVYERQDRALGRMMAAFGGPGPEAVVLVVSDHGFGPAERVQNRSVAVTGTHRRDGILIAAGGPLRKDAEITTASVYDVAPTVLHLLGLPASVEMPGEVLVQAWPDPSGEAARTRRIPTWEGPPGTASAYPPPESFDRDKIEQLRSLGYFE